MQSLQNSFIFTFDNFLRQEIPIICNKNMGVGADGFVKIYHKDGFYGYDFYNKDGSSALFCGNATLCLTSFLHKNKLIDSKSKIITPSGEKEVFIFGKGRWERPVVEVGEISFQKSNCPKSVFNKLLFLKSGNKTLRVRASVVYTGNLHLVIIGKFSQSYQREIVGAVNNSGLFFDGVNVEFAYKENKKIIVSVYERGVGKTLSCASGGAAVFALFNKLGLYKGESITFGGQKLLVNYRAKKVFISSYPKFLFSGRWDKNASKVGL